MLVTVFSAETEKELLLSERRSVVDRDVSGKATGENSIQDQVDRKEILLKTSSCSEFVSVVTEV